MPSPHCGQPVLCHAVLCWPLFGSLGRDVDQEGVKAAPHQYVQALVHAHRLIHVLNTPHHLLVDLQQHITGLHSRPVETEHGRIQGKMARAPYPGSLPADKGCFQVVPRLNKLPTCAHVPMIPGHAGCRGGSSAGIGGSLEVTTRHQVPSLPHSQGWGWQPFPPTPQVSPSQATGWTSPTPPVLTGGLGSQR